MKGASNVSDSWHRIETRTGHGFSRECSHGDTVMTFALFDNHIDRGRALVCCSVLRFCACTINRSQFRRKRLVDWQHRLLLHGYSNSRMADWGPRVFCPRVVYNTQAMYCPWQWLATPMNATAQRKRRRRPQQQQLLVTGATVIPVITGFLASAIVGWTLLFSDQTELFLLAAILLLLLTLATLKLLEWIARCDDGAVDRYEQQFLYVPEFVKWLLIYMVPMFAFIIITSMLTQFALPLWYESIGLLAVFMAILVGVMPAHFNTLVGAMQGTTSAVVVGTSSALG